MKVSMYKACIHNPQPQRREVKEGSKLERGRPGTTSSRLTRGPGRVALARGVILHARERGASLVRRRHAGEVLGRGQYRVLQAFDGRRTGKGLLRGLFGRLLGLGWRWRQRGGQRLLLDVLLHDLHAPLLDGGRRRGQGRGDSLPFHVLDVLAVLNVAFLDGVLVQARPWRRVPLVFLGRRRGLNLEGGAPLFGRAVGAAGFG